MYNDAAATNVARHYSDRRGQTLQERKRSDIFLLRELNNWVRSLVGRHALRWRADVCSPAQVKAALIREFTRRGDFVLVRVARFVAPARGVR